MIKLVNYTFKCKLFACNTTQVGDKMLKSCVASVYVLIK